MQKKFFYTKKLCTVLGILLSLVLVGCDKKNAGLTPLGSDAVILAFGDSLTLGIGTGNIIERIEADNSYPARLATLTGRTVIRSGVPGETTEKGLKRLPGVLVETNPDLVILCHGGNDFLQGKSDAQIKDNLRSMIAMIKARGTQVVLIGVPKARLRLSTASLYEELARELSIPLEEDVLADILSNPSLKADFVHPNAAGYAAMAKAVFLLLQEAGAL